MPRLSLVLIDWSVRESFHVLKYLSEQTANRADYEIIWIEFYSSRKAMYFAADKFVILEMPQRVYYHKHLMYNVGILQAKGDIVCIMDSDAIVKNTFVEAIIKVFDGAPNTVLHLDQVRNHDRKFYPFNYPTVDDITAGKNHNWRHGTTLGMLDTEDMLHKRNYGACMAAKKSDLLRIGGADEHIDYLGYICGPYDMTFRLINAGVKELWHPTEFIYHVWHPSEGGGKNNHQGPHDGHKMSSRALANRDTRRILPHVENPAIKTFSYDVVTSERLRQWSLSS